ncbi:MAG: ShlB/FhaC/HecB family hemolysin secretion/activation protein [Veillonellales bacterium]
MNKNRVALAAIILWLNASIAQAAPVVPDDAGSTLRRSAEMLEQRKLNQDLQENRQTGKEPITDNTDKTKEKAAADDSVRFFVSEIVVNESQILKPEEIKAITGKYEGKSVTLKDIYTAVAEFNELYEQKQYITARAILPPQKIENGIVKIRLVEGRVGKIVLEGAKYTAESFVTNRISLKNGDLVSVDKLSSDLLYFNGTNDVQLHAELRPGKEFGTTDVVIKLQEPKVLQTSLFVDNAGRDTTGLYRTGLSIEQTSLTGARDPLSLTGMWARGTLYGSASYSYPISVKGTRLGINYSKNRINIIDGELRALDVAGNSSDFGLSLTQPLHIKPSLKIEGFAELHTKKSDNSFTGIQLAENKVDTTVLGFSVLSYDGAGIWYTRHEFTSGKEETTHSNNQNFNRYNCSIIRQKKISNTWQLTVRADTQFAAMKQPLPSTEQFYIGGMTSVRGYPEGYRAGNQGYSLSAEGSFPLSKELTGIIFVDHGAVRPVKGNKETSNADDVLTSMGVGVNMNFTNQFSGKVAVGVPLRGDVGIRLHLSFQYGL